MGNPYVAPTTSPAPAGPRRQGYAIASLVLGLLSLPTLGLVFVGAILSIVFGVTALVKASRYPEEYGGKGLAIGGIVAAGVSIVIMPFVIGIIAAIAIPSFLRARVSANEAVAIGDVRSVISAQVAYQATYGHYDTLECLADPAACAPGREGAPSFLDAQLAGAADKSGYRRTFVPGPPAEDTGSPTRSPTALESWAYLAVPSTPNRTGVRAFCGDARGRICYWLDASAASPAALTGGVCPEECRTLH